MMPMPLYVYCTLCRIEIQVQTASHGLAGALYSVDRWALI